MGNLIRRAAAVLAACAIIISVPSGPRAAQVVPAIDPAITYILPQWFEFLTASDVELDNQAQRLRTLIGPPDGRRVKVGFTTYITITMHPVDPQDPVAVRAGLASAFAEIDEAIARARRPTVNLPICLSFLTAIRNRTDPLQLSAEAEDRRNTQWHSDHSRAPGWMTLSRYARKQRAIHEAYLRELGRFLAQRMAEYPETLVAASGDGEVELSYEMSIQFNEPRRTDNLPTLLADYSPFAVAEFRDWLRGTGLYATGQPFAGQAYRNSARYTGDTGWVTLNADFGTSFRTWNLKFEDWSLTDGLAPDPHAIPQSIYSQPGWVPATTAPEINGYSGFDPPRIQVHGNAWSDLWDEFRQTMVWRHNQDFAKWITTSPDPVTGATVPADRWFSDQIAADYLFGNTPQNPDPRLDTSASPHWTADIRPYGSLGITAFSQFNPTTGTMHKTLAGVAPVIAARGVRWGIFEWNPSAPPQQNLNVYRDEVALVDTYRPSLLVPYVWNTGTIDGTPFATALRELIARLNVVPLVLSRTSLVTATTTNGAHRTPAQLVRVGGVSGETPQWSIASASEFLEVALSPDGRGFTVAPKALNYPLQQHTGTVVVSSTDPGYSPATLTVTVNVAPANGSAPPFGSFDTPAEAATVSGEVGVTGWAIDDIGIAGIDIYRTSVAPEAPNTFIFLGSATMVPGARPDVQAAYAVRPLAEQAGWGYMLLTNMLPNQGKGSFVLHAFARDVDGYTVVLGSRMITAQNGGSDSPPFGTIDTPSQGQTVSGTIPNWGWAVSPNLIPTDGSTIAVYIDNVFVGRPAYNKVRPDIAGFFPNYPNTMNGNGAVGLLEIDTTRYANGVHTIAWVVTDGAGRSSGIGSRYFTIANP